jgi:ribonuclease VapC
VNAVVDSSAMLAVFQREAGYEVFRDFLADTASLVSAVTRVEAAAVVMSRMGTPGLRRLEQLFDELSVDVVDLDAAQTGLALEALERYGRGRRRPPAVLNFGDVFAYALAKSRDLPLLYKGGDFDRTDIRSALPSAPP